MIAISLLVLINFILLLIYKNNYEKDIENLEKKTERIIETIEKGNKLIFDCIEENQQTHRELHYSIFQDYAGFQNEIMDYLGLEFDKDNKIQKRKK